MRNVCYAVLTLVLVMLGGKASAGEGITLDHTLVSYIADAETVTLEYVLHVENGTAEPVYDLTLEHVPIEMVPTDLVVLENPVLDAGASADVTFTMAILTPIEEVDAAETALNWAGSYTDTLGNVVELPMTSTVIPAEEEGGTE